MSTVGDLAGRIRAPRVGPQLSTRRVLLLYLPSALVILAVLLPVAYLILRALEADSRSWNVLLRTSTLRILANSLGLAVSVTAASVLLSVALAWLTVRTDLPGRRMWALLTALPLVIPSYVGAYLMASALGPRGLVQGILGPLFGIDRLPSIYGFSGAFITLTLLSFPLVLLPVRAALRRMDPALEDSARSLGQNTWGVFRKVTLPHLRPSVAAGALLVALYSLRDFGAVSIMRFTTFTRAIYVQYESAFDRSSAALLSLVLVAITMLLLSLELRSRREGRRYNSAENGNGKHVRIQLGHWRWPALVLCAGVVTLALLLPALVLAYWLLRALQQGPELTDTLLATGNSLVASGLAAILVLAASVPIAVLAVRSPGAWSRWSERLAHVGFALPGIVVALALVFFGIRAARLLYQTLPMLLLAYLILFLPLAIGSLRSSLLQVPSILEEAGRSLGRSPLEVFRRVTLPLVRPGLVAGAALVFLTAMKELQATLILSPYGFTTLATEVWSSVSEAFFARAAGPALLLILVSSVPMAYFVLRDDAA